MAVYKELKTNTWKVYYRYTDWQGERKQTTKRGFLTKREALAWEREQLTENPEALSMAIELAKKTDASLVFGTDPIPTGSALPQR